jgi:hypothetical protein
MLLQSVGRQSAKAAEQSNTITYQVATDGPLRDILPFSTVADRHTEQTMARFSLPVCPLGAAAVFIESTTPAGPP